MNIQRTSYWILPFFSHHIDFEDKMQFGKPNDKYPLLQRHFAGPGFFL